MAALTYVGAAQANPADLSDEAYVSSLTAMNLPQSTVDSMMASGFAPYVLKSYVDAQDAKNATKTYVDAGDATRLHVNQLGVNNGIAPLDGTGKIASARVNVASTQRWPKPFYSPATYNSSTVTATTAETTVYSCAITDPGYTYKLLVTGLVDTSTQTDTVYPVVRVRVGNATTGPVVAGAYGLAESYFISPNGGTDTFPYTGTLHSADWTLSNESGVPGAGELVGNNPGVSYNQINGNALVRRATRANSADAITGTDFQQMTVVVNAIPVFGNDVEEWYLRMNSAGTQYVKLRMTGVNSSIQWIYNNGSGDNFAQVPTGMTMAAGDTWQFIAGANSITKKYDFLRAPSGSSTFTSITSFTDTTNTVIGSSNRGWGFALGTAGGGASPGKYSSITIGDGVKLFNAGPSVLIPANVDTQSARTGATTLYVTLASSDATSTVSASTLKPSLYVMPIPA